MGVVLYTDLNGNVIALPAGTEPSGQYANFEPVTLQVENLLAGQMLADIVIAGTFKTAESPNPRVVIDSTGIIGYSDETTKEFYIATADGKAYFGGGYCSLDNTGLHFPAGLDIMTFGDESTGYELLFDDEGNELYLMPRDILTVPETCFRSHFLRALNSLQLHEDATPTAIADYGQVYTKPDNKLYFQDGAGNEHEIAFA